MKGCGDQKVIKKVNELIIEIFLSNIITLIENIVKDNSYFTVL